MFLRKLMQYIQNIPIRIPQSLCHAMLVLIICITLFGCSDEQDNKTQHAKQKEYYEFINANNKEIVQITIQHTEGNVQLPMINKHNAQSILDNNKVKVIAFFPKECNMCMPTLIHLNNLLGRTKALQVIVLSEQALHANTYRDIPITLNTHIINLVDKDKKFGLFIDSLKRTLNIEIRDYKVPLFLLQDTQNNTTQSIEGAVLEEIFEQEITQLLAPNNATQDSHNETKIQTPNNTLSQTAPSSINTLNTNQ